VTGGAIVPALVLAAVGLALAAAPRSAWRPALLALVATTTLGATAPLPASWADAVFLGCWISVAAGAAAVHWPGGLGGTAALALAINGGAWAGAAGAVTGRPLDALAAAPAALVVLPAAWLAQRRAGVAVKVGASWLITVAVLATALQFLPVTPGYLPDHLD